jgi:hypothetical protein
LKRRLKQLKKKALRILPKNSKKINRKMLLINTKKQSKRNVTIELKTLSYNYAAFAGRKLTRLMYKYTQNTNSRRPSPLSSNSNQFQFTGSQKIIHSVYPPMKFVSGYVTNSPLRAIALRNKRRFRFPIESKSVTFPLNRFGLTQTIDTNKTYNSDVKLAAIISSHLKQIGRINYKAKPLTKPILNAVKSVGLTKISNYSLGKIIYGDAIKNRFNLNKNRYISPKKKRLELIESLRLSKKYKLPFVKQHSFQKIRKKKVQILDENFAGQISINTRLGIVQVVISSIGNMPIVRYDINTIKKHARLQEKDNFWADSYKTWRNQSHLAKTPGKLGWPASIEEVIEQIENFCIKKNLKELHLYSGNNNIAVAKKVGLLLNSIENVDIVSTTLSASRAHNGVRAVGIANKKMSRVARLQKIYTKRSGWHAKTFVDFDEIEKSEQVRLTERVVDFQPKYLLSHAQDSDKRFEKLNTLNLETYLTPRVKK